MSLVVGLMSGTSMDGIDACLVEIRSKDNVQLKLIEFLTKPYPVEVHEDLMRISARDKRREGDRGVVADVCRYNFLLGHLFAEAAKEVVVKAGHSVRDINIIGSHGQTIHHLPSPQPPLHGYHISSTLQIGDPAVIAGECGVTTVGDFRVADMSLGGQGAPLVPYMDHNILSTHYKETGRIGVLVNIGGISNATILIPVTGELIGFDCGPGNVLIDALMREWYKAEYDENGHIANEGEVSKSLLDSLMIDCREYLQRQPPKSLGKEEYDDGYIKSIIARSREYGLTQQDTVATVTVFTAAMISESYERHMKPKIDQTLDGSKSASGRDMFVSGGGAHNTTLMSFLQERLSTIQVSTTSAIGVDPDAKEAMCFALLAYQTMNGVCTNIPSVTGASKKTILGKICPVPS